MAQLSPFEQRLIDKNPELYRLHLRRQGIPESQALQMVAAKFGTTGEGGGKKTPGLGQQIGTAAGGIASTVAGYKGAQYVYNKAGELGDKLKNSLFGSTTPEATTPNATPVPADTFQAPAPTPMATPDAGMMGTPVPPPAAQAPVSTPMGRPQAGQMGTPTPWSDTVQIDTPQGPMQVPKDLANDTGFLSDVNWQSIGQGAMGAMQLYNAYQQYKGGDKVGAGISGTAGAVNIAAAAGSETAAAFVPGVNVAAGLYQGYQTAKMVGDTPAGGQRTQRAAVGGAQTGAMIGSAFGPLGMLIGGAAGALWGATLEKTTGSGKGKAQFTRDVIREQMQKKGVLDDKFQGTLADGTKYDFGKDGSYLKWKNIDKAAQENPEAWKGAVPLTDAIGTAYGFVGQKASDMSAWFARAAVSNANNDPEIAKQNARHFAQQQGITFDMIKGNLDNALKDNRINEAQYNYYLTGAKDLGVGGAAPTPAVNPMTTVRPKAGEVVRVSPGMYRNDRGELTRARSTRQALERNYRRS